MKTVLRRGALALLLLLFVPSLIAEPQPWDQPAFTADPKALLAAARKVEAGDYATVFLLDESEYVIQDDRGAAARSRLITYVVTDAGVEYAGEVRESWMPWVDERPTIEARVITKEGTVHHLDQAAVVEVPANEEGDIFSDGRVLRAPLPAVAAGSVVEYVITRRSNSPIEGGGMTENYYFGGYFPAERTRLVIDAPLAIEPRIVNRTGIEPRIEEKDGRRRMVYETGRIEGQREIDEDLPYDQSPIPHLAFSTGSSWQEIATSYSRIVDKQIAGSDLKKLVRGALGNARERGEVVSRLLAAIQKDIRYAGVEIGEGSIVPRPPQTVLANKYGDCKDKATLLVAMLREAGFPAHVALLNAGTDLDTSAELPGVSRFNHAIVVVEGEPAIWVDPTDVFARAGELPLLDQGRMALIASPETTTVVRTPETESTAHVYRERRTFYLPEEGKARVVEVTEPARTSEAAMRRWVTRLDAKGLRENLEEYAKSAYVAKTISKHEATAATDLTTPFRLTIEVPESKSGVVSNGEATVAINATALPAHIPAALRDWREPQPGDDPDDAPKPRKHDFQFLEPSVREWVYRIVPPAGYVPRTLPANETLKLGTITYSQELHAEPDQSVTATFRVDSGKRRLGPAEFQETRVAFSKFIEDKTINVTFEQAGQAKLAAGDVRGALDEFRRLTELHPKEAQHHIETANALLTSGLGDAARDEIRRAIAIEPKKARAHHILGHILLHDALGRPYRRGFDLAGGIAALRKAKELDSDDYSIRVPLASALTYGTDGLRFGRGAHLEEAIEEYKALARDLGDQGKAMLPELTLVYGHLGRFADLREIAPTYEDQQQRELGSIIATAALDGKDAALRELGAYNQQQQRQYANGAGQALMQFRRYPEAAALIDTATQGTPAAAQQRQFIDMLARLERLDAKSADNGPKGLVMRFFRTMLHADHEGVKQLFPARYASDAELLEGMAMIDLRPPDGVAPAVFLDVLAAMMQIQQDSDGGSGQRLRIRMLGGGATDGDMALFARQDNGRWVLAGASKGALSMIGDTVLEMTAKGELEPARLWLNWAREEVKGGSGDDPLDGAAFAALWPRSKTSATADEIRVAAASLAVDKFGWDISEPVLVAARENAPSNAAKAAIDLSLLSIYSERKEPAKALVVAQRLAEAHPDSATAFSSLVAALLESGKAANATALAKARLERLPDDRDAVHALASIASETLDYAAAQQYALRVVDDLRPKRNDFTFAAWLSLFTGKELQRAIEHAQHATQQKAGDDDEKGDDAPDSQLTLAALYAETGKSVEARAALLQAIDADNRALAEQDWYVLGRIAENYGVDDFAIAAYRKVGAESGGATVTRLAQKRLEGLTAGKTKKK
jgi:Tfp pilus assembly protein PilF